MGAVLTWLLCLLNFYLGVHAVLTDGPAWVAALSLTIAFGLFMLLDDE